VICGPAFGQYLPKLKPLRNALPFENPSTLRNVSSGKDLSSGSTKVPVKNVGIF